MRDSHVGAFAVVGVLGLLILKYGALLSLLSLLNVPGKEWVLLLFPVFSRWTMVLLLRIFPYSRARGLGASFHLGNNGIATIAAAIMATAAGILLGGAGGAVILVGVSILALLLGQGMAKMLGGGTYRRYLRSHQRNNRGRGSAGRGGNAALRVDYPAPPDPAARLTSGCPAA